MTSEALPTKIVGTLDFAQVIQLSYQLLHNKEWDEALQEYAAKLLEALQKRHLEVWNSSWRYDAFLGYVYHIILKYDERYEAFKRALARVSSPPPQLLVAMARCCFAPGKPPVMKEEAISLIKQAIKQASYIEAVELLRGIYKSMGNVKEEAYWHHILDSIGENGQHLPSLGNNLFDP